MSILKKYLIPVLLFLFLPKIHFGQRFQKDSSSNKVRNVIWIIPVGRNTTINGLAVGFMPVPWRKAQRLTVNGISISASPVDPFVAAMAIGMSLGELFTVIESPFVRKKVKRDDFFDHYLPPKEADSKWNTVLNGLVIGGVTGRDRVNGVNLTFVGNITSHMRGLSVSSLFNVHDSLDGVAIAGLWNIIKRGKGLQIGLVNQCREGRVVQIGLINKIGKRTLPILNFRL